MLILKLVFLYLVVVVGLVVAFVGVLMEVRIDLYPSAVGVSRNPDEAFKAPDIPEEEMIPGLGDAAQEAQEQDQED